jgi:hypothetical protein
VAGHRPDAAVVGELKAGDVGQFCPVEGLGGVTREAEEESLLVLDERGPG